VQWPNLASDGVVVIQVDCIATPIQVLLLALMARRAGADPAKVLAVLPMFSCYVHASKPGPPPAFPLLAALDAPSRKDFGLSGAPNLGGNGQAGTRETSKT
jgi:hypothetical protein